MPKISVYVNDDDALMLDALKQDPEFSQASLFRQALADEFERRGWQFIPTIKIPGHVITENIEKEATS